MRFNLDNLFVNMPENDTLGYVFDLPKQLFDNRAEAEAARTFVHTLGGPSEAQYEKTVTLREAFRRISTDIHNDS